VCKGIGDSVWEFPGGRLHDGEDPSEGLRREIKEELGIDVVVDRPVYLARSYHGKSKVWQVFVAYQCTAPKDAQIIADKSEVEDMQWIPREEIMALPMFPDCEGALKAYFGVR